MAEPEAPGLEMGDVADVTNSTAFLSIDSLLEEGKLVEERATHLKAKYKELHDRVLQIYNHDNFLLKRARQCRKDLETEKTKVEKCGEVARLDDTQIQQLKKELATAEHELSIAQEKESMLQVEALELDRKKQNLIHEVEDAIAAEEARLKPQIESLHTDIKDLGLKIEQTAKKFDELRAQREAVLEKDQHTKDQMAHQETVIYEAKVEFSRVEREPDRAKKQADIVVKANLAAGKELRAITDKVEVQNQYLRDLEDKRRQIEAHKVELLESLETNRDEMKSKLEANTLIKSHLDSYRQAQRDLIQHIANLEQRMRNAQVATVAERDALNHAHRDKDEGMKDYKSIDQAKSDLLADKEMLHKQMETLTRERHRLNTTRNQCGKSLEELKRDVDILINNFLKEEIAEKRCITDKEDVHRLIKQLEDQVAELSTKEQNMKRDASQLAIRREQRSRECSRNEGRVMIAKNELKVKEVVVRELKKRHDELHNHLMSLMEMYTAVKRERSAKAAQIQSASQTMSEHEEKIKILDNELEVLRRESIIKDHELAKKRRESHEMDQSCKNLKVEHNKARRRLEAEWETERDLKNQMRKLNSAITRTEDEMLALRKNYEDAVENRNYTGIQLIDRNDELCILYEKANIQEDILRNGLLHTNRRNEEIGQATHELGNIQREIEVCQNVLPQVRDLEEDLAQTLQDMQDERWRAEVLEKELTDPKNAARWRKLGRVAKKGDPGATTTGSPTKSTKSEGAAGPSADLLELSRKQQELSQRIATVNERLMEKDLILEEVTELSNNLRKQALSGRDFTLALAKRVNNYQFGIKQKTKQMMATLSELSMVQASSIQMNAQVQALQDEVRGAKERSTQGLPPSEQAIQEIERQDADAERRREAARLKKEKLALEESATGLRTTAEQRANAYIPSEDLAISKPYGSHAPFKPTMHAQLNVSRYYRKSRLPDLDIDEDD